MPEPALNLSDNEEKSTTLDASNDNAGGGGGRTIKVNKGGNTNVGNLKPGEKINLEFDVPIEGMKDNGMSPGLNDVLADDNSFTPPEVTDENAIAPSSAKDTPTPTMDSDQSNDTSNEPPQMESQGNENSDSSTNNQAGESENSDAPSNTPEKSTPASTPAGNESAPSTPTSAPQSEENGTGSNGQPSPSPSQDSEDTNKTSKDNGTEGENKEEANGYEKDGENGENEKTDEEDKKDEKNGNEQGDENRDKNDKEIEKKDGNQLPAEENPENKNDKEPPTIPPNENLENPPEDKTPPEVNPQQPEAQQPFQAGNGPATEPEQVSPGKEGEAGQNMQQQKNEDRAGNQMNDSESPAEESGLGDRVGEWGKNKLKGGINKLKQGAKNKIKGAVDNVTPEFIKNNKLKKEKRKILKKLAKLDKSFNGIANSKSFGIISFFMPGLGASITSTMSKVSGIKDEFNEAKLKSKIIPLKTIISTLEVARTGASIIDALKVWGSLFIETWWTIIMPLLLIITLPAFLIFYYLFNGILSKSIKKVKEKFEKILKPLKEKLKKVTVSKKLRNRMEQIDSELKFSKQNKQR